MGAPPINHDEAVEDTLAILMIAHTDLYINELFAAMQAIYAIEYKLRSYRNHLEIMESNGLIAIDRSNTHNYLVSLVEPAEIMTANTKGLVTSQPDFR